MYKFFINGLLFICVIILLSCNKNQLSNLDVSNNTAIKYLHCDGNLLTSLDVTKLSSLQRLTCSVNPITSLDVSHNTALF